VTDFCDMEPYSLFEVNRRFRDVYCIHKGRLSRGWRQYALLKRRSTSKRLHGATSQKAVPELPYIQFVVFNTSMECLGRVVKAPTSYSGGPGFDSRPARAAILIEVFRGFPQSLQANAGIVR
jgi:hypothetical protein